MNAQMRVMLFRNGKEFASFETPWGSEMAATVPDSLDHVEIRIVRIEREAAKTGAIEPSDSKQSQTKLAEKLDAAAKG